MIPIPNPVRDRLAAGELAIGVAVRALRSVEVARIMKTCGYDWLFIDLEHGSTSIETAAGIMTAALDAGITPIVRVPEGESAMAARCLDAGALGIVISHVETAEDARAAVAELRFPPLGRRSIGGNYAQLGFRSTSARDAAPALDAATLVIATLETARGIENAEAIAAVPGVDIVQVGSNDLTLSMGVPGQLDHPKLAAAMETVVRACAAHGKFPGFGGVYRPDLMQKYIGLGMRFVLGGSDINLLMAAAEERARFVRGCHEGTR